MTITIRPAESKDLETIWEMWKTIIEQKVYYPYDDSFTQQDIMQSLSLIHI